LAGHSFPRPFIAEAAHHPSIPESGDRIQGNVLPTHDPTEDAMNFDEETVEKTLRLWAGIPFSGVPVQSRRVWQGLAMTEQTNKIG
jgi:hypothetical protein